MSSEPFEQIECQKCGILFHIPQRIGKGWRTNGKSFHCPNGCTLSWPKPTPEVEALRTQVAELTIALASAEKEAAKFKLKADLLQLELDIWKPDAAAVAAN